MQIPRYHLCTLVTLASLFSGCSIIGFAVGSALDHSTTRREAVSYERALGAVRHSVELHLRDGRVLRGTLARVTATPDTVLVLRLPVLSEFAKGSQVDSIRVPIGTIATMRAFDGTGAAALGMLGLAIDAYTIYFFRGIAWMHGD